MPRLRRNEWNFAHLAASLITQILAEDEFAESPLGHAEPELTELRGARRLDLVVFSREDEGLPIITGETKVPWVAEGRTPYNSNLVEAAHGKASRAAALYFITWNVRRIVVWKTDDPGVELSRRAVFDKEIFSGPLASPDDLDRRDFRESLYHGVKATLLFLNSSLIGPPLPEFLPLDRLFINTIEAALDDPIARTTIAVSLQMDASPAVKREVQKWMRESQRWVVAESTIDDNIDRAARFTCYVLVNRICFYNALRRRFPELQRIQVANNINTGERLQRRLASAFRDAERFTGNYETVFDGDYGDNFPFFSDEAVAGWRELIRTLDHYDFARINLDVIGAMYEQLIKPEERHRFGQHYTQPAVVDLINSFVLNTGNETLMDPSCGGGTFLVRAYARKSHLDERLDHNDLLQSIYGCDVLNYACHLSLINLAIRDLIDDDNFPRIHLGDFLALRPGALFDRQPVRIHAGGLVNEMREIMIEENQFHAIVGNPPYIQSKEMSAAARHRYFAELSRQWPEYSWSRASDIYVYFWVHAMRFLQEDGRLAYLTQAAWLDVEYGIPLQRWMLDNFRIIAILETEAEPWFTGARVATVVTVLQRDADEHRRRQSRITFVQFRHRLSNLVAPDLGETDRQTGFEQLRASLLEGRDREEDGYRVRYVPQGDLYDAGLEENRYVGSKWGRYLRSTTTLYDLQTRLSNSFVPLRQLAGVQRGATTNCDSFFLVTDVSADETASIPNARAFRERFGVHRSDVVDGEIAIVSRRDGVKLPLERIYLRRIVRTARDYEWFTTAHFDPHAYAVFLPNDRNISRLVAAYVRSGERERWHLSPSFAEDAGRPWYSLRNEDAGPILFVKTMQYSPFALWNGANLLANQRLYKVSPVAGVDPEAFCAILNSTLFATERYAAVKALGKEAAIDVEVFSVRAFRTPDLRRFPVHVIEALRNAMRRLVLRQVGPLLEEQLLQAGHSEALIYAEQHPVGPNVWPTELVDPIRQEIDALVLEGIGVNRADIAAVRSSLYDEIIAHVRKLRIVELEAQANRRGNERNVEPSPQELADDMWAQLLVAGNLEPRIIPNDFVGVDQPFTEFTIPSGEFAIRNPNLFDAADAYLISIGRRNFEVESQAHSDLIRNLVEMGIKGRVHIPQDTEVCQNLLPEIRTFFDRLMVEMTHLIEQSTADAEFQADIRKAVIRRITPH